MKLYLAVLGWWNLVGCWLMLGWFHEPFGKKVLNEWTRLFVTPFTLDYWSKLWLIWAIGLNIVFALMNILAAQWGFEPLMIFSVVVDLTAYSLFIGLSIWGIRAKRLGAGAVSLFVVFGGWLVWGAWCLCDEVGCF